MDKKYDISPELQEVFSVEANIDRVVVVGECEEKGRRQLVLLKEGIMTGMLKGRGMGAGVDCQIIRNNGITDISARYAFKLDDGNSIFIENNGIRRVCRTDDGREGMYFVAQPKFEVYCDELKWLEESMFISYGIRLPDSVCIKYYKIL